MKRPKPSIPKIAPKGTIWFGGPIEWFSITLRIRGENLVPDEITQLLRCKPHKASPMGMPIFRKDGTVMRRTQFSLWMVLLKSEDTDEWDCGEVLLEFLKRLPSDIKVWRTISKRYTIDFFIAMRMTGPNKGFSLSSEVMKCLADRDIEVGFDIYYRKRRMAK